ncbi:MAG: GNAT family N-acetyltransferase [Planctomycetes bacterium]|nr:GNAT family N-acetyltransferase [Planctomycetota bacterium]
MSGVRGPGSGVRLARSSDLDAILALEHAAFPPQDRFPRRSWRRLLTVDSAICLVIDGPRTPDTGHRTVMASIAWLLRRGSGNARMYSLSVHPDARGRGLARALVDASLRRLPRGVTTLSLEVRRDNGPAVGLYCALGFIETALLRQYYGRGRHGIRMRATRAAVRQALSANRA